MGQDKSYIRSYVSISLLSIFILLLYYISRGNFLFFHSVAELFSIIIAFSIFIIALNTNNPSQNNYFMFLGVAYGFVGGFDFLHVVAYLGIEILPGYDTSIQFWIIARYIEGVSLLLAVLVVNRKINLYTLIGLFTLASTLLTALALYVTVGTSYFNGKGLALSHMVSEYAIAGILLIALFFIYRAKLLFHQQVFLFIILSLVTTIASGLSVALQSGSTGLAMVLGHLFKLVSFYFIYRALVVTSLSEPQNLLYYELAQAKNKSLQVNEQLTREIKSHKTTARMLQRINRALKVLSESNRVITGAQNESQLLKSICRVIVEVGGYHSAWIGYAQQNISRTVCSPARDEGDGERGGDTVVSASWTSRELKPGAKANAQTGGHGAIKERRDGVGKSNWYGKSRPGTMSEFAVPLVLDNQILGSINIMSAERDAFNAVETELLTKLSQNLSYGINLLHSRAEKKKAEDALRESEEKFRLLFHNANDAIFLLSADDEPSRFLEVNDVSCRKFGYSRNEFLSKNIEEIIFNQEPQNYRAYLNECIEKGHATYELNVKSKAGNVVPIEANGHLFMLKDKKVMLSIARDITERKQAEEQLKFISLHDSLTGIYNRSFFEREMNRLDRRHYHPVGIIISDVDGLKLVNDTLGHDAGDSLLVNASIMIKQCFRDGDMVARIGGDEFAVLLPGVEASAVEVARKRIKAAISSYNETNPELPLSVSIGSAVSSEGFVRMRELFKEADNNMYREKLHRRQSARSSIVQTLIKALEERDFITGGHGERLKDLVVGMASTIGLQQSAADLQLLAQFHDIGKVGIPDRILFKQGPLTTEETREMQRHCEIGYRIAQSAPELGPIAEWILKHHEWWNGDGYPLGLKGEEIPLECRILAIADAYDAMTTDRPYRRALSFEEAARELRKNSGIQFDPNLVDVFIQWMRAS